MISTLNPSENLVQHQESNLEILNSRHAVMLPFMLKMLDSFQEIIGFTQREQLWRLEQPWLRV